MAAKVITKLLSRTEKTSTPFQKRLSVYSIDHRLVWMQCAKLELGDHFPIWTRDYRRIRLEQGITPCGCGANDVLRSSFGDTAIEHVFWKFVYREGHDEKVVWVMLSPFSVVGALIYSHSRSPEVGAPQRFGSIIASELRCTSRGASYRPHVIVASSIAPRFPRSASPPARPLPRLYRWESSIGRSALPDGMNRDRGPFRVAA